MFDVPFCNFPIRVHPWLKKCNDTISCVHAKCETISHFAQALRNKLIAPETSLFRFCGKHYRKFFFKPAMC
jgi:hypothetical protein